MSEKKEDEFAAGKNDLAEAKEDLEQTQTTLDADLKFLKNLKETCAEADTNFEARKNSRMEEIKAVGETIEILTADEARDAMSGTYSFVQVSAHRQGRRSRAASLLRRAAARSHSSELSALASTVELDAFDKVKKSIDGLVATLKTQQADEVKKNNWCTDELQKNDMAKMKNADHTDDLTARENDLESRDKTLTDETKAAMEQIDQLHVELQRAAQNRKDENMEFQKTVADQTVTLEVLAKALDKLASFYDKELFVQTGTKQTPPVPQMEYKKSGGATGIMSMIEKLIHEAKGIREDAKTTEKESQKAYETIIADTNEAVESLMQSAATKKQEKASTGKKTVATQGDIQASVKEGEGLAKLDADLHEECDYILKNFDARQKARGDEIESLQQAKQILSGADLS